MFECGRCGELFRHEGHLEKDEHGISVCRHTQACGQRVRRGEYRAKHLDPFVPPLRFPPGPEYVHPKDECPECRHSMSRRHLADGSCTIGGCGHDPNGAHHWLAA